MRVRLHRFSLPLEHEFTIARESISVQRSLVVELEQDGLSGFGEVTENAFYGHTLSSMSAAIEACSPALRAHTLRDPAKLWEELRPTLADDFFALSAIDAAAYDLYGKLTHRYTHDLLGLAWNEVPHSSYTIGIDTMERMIAKLEQRPGWPIYKIKLGTPHDVEIVSELRARTTAVFRVDANCGWTVDDAIERSHALKGLGVEFVEQPLPAMATDDQQRRLFAESALPVIADESCLTESDVERCVERFHGINIKLCKCGGLTPAVRMLRRARQHGMQTMVGCMVESSIGISAAAQLLPLLDHADLDGALLISADPGMGATVDQGAVTLPDRFGNGCELRDAIANRLSVDGADSSSRTRHAPG